ncbi:MAG TPA: sigma-70 family RNA polymerase sigma factor [Jatrophihabitantaceae bacterium]|nr:sigma-70 family RNA polymerase sigma factor [Jatrophihabitantaceae bacterium]
MPSPDPRDVRHSIETVWRMESAKVVATLVRLVRDVQVAEDLAQDALVAALQQWPDEGIPANPAAWLTAIAKRRAIDSFRRAERHDRAVASLGRDLEEAEVPDLDAGLDDTIDDDLLRLMFICCAPVLSTQAQVALTLRLLGGLTTAEIARAYVTPEPTIGQRISRAKKTIAKERIAFEEPDRDDRRRRLSSVLSVVYLIFNEGYAATSGDAWTRPALTAEALRLGRVLAGIAPDVAAVHGLQALMEIQASRDAARTGPDGEPVLLLDQDRSRWDQLLIRRGLAALERAEQLSTQPDRYVLQAGIAACHARAYAPEETDWHRIAGLYGELAGIDPSPIVALNRAVAIAMADGPEAGLPLVDAIAASGMLDRYHLLPSVRGDLLAKLGRVDEARAEFERAAAMTQNARERALLLDRAAATGQLG